MTACATCGKCPCYGHERKTVMAEETKEGTHVERMAELRHEWEPSTTRGMVRCSRCDYVAFEDSETRNALLCGDKEEETRAYLAAIAAQLEAERSTVEALCADLARSGLEMMQAAERNAANVAKLQAAERVVLAARSYRATVAAVKVRGEPDGAVSEAWLALGDAIEEYDRAATGDDAGKESGCPE